VLQQIKYGLVQQLYSPPYAEYVTGLGISNLRDRQERGEIFDLAPGELIDDACIVVLLKRELPESLPPPSEPEGVRLFYDVVGEMELHEVVER